MNNAMLYRPLSDTCQLGCRNTEGDYRDFKNRISELEKCSSIHYYNILSTISSQQKMVVVTGNKDK